jgi:hypothetical protein
MAAADLGRMEHQPYSPNRAPCNFFPFGYIKGKLVEKQFSTPEDVVSGVRNIIKGIRPAVLKMSSNPRREDCWIVGILVVNMWSKMCILVLYCLLNFACVPRVRVNNGHRVIMNRTGVQ